MKKIVFSVVIMILISLWIATPVLTTKPLRVHFKQPWFGGGVLCLMFGIALIYTQGVWDGKALTEKITREILEEFSEENK